MAQSCSADQWIEVKGPFTDVELRALKRHGSIDRLSNTHQPLLTTSVARGLTEIASVDYLWLWCPVTRAAMKYVVAIPNLRVLDVLYVKPPGQLNGFSEAANLQELRCNHCLNAADLLEIASCKSLRQVGAQSCEITISALDALLALPHLESIDLEGSNFNDKMAPRLHRSGSLRSLDLGSTSLTRKGLQTLVKLKQLRQLDLWATNITEPDLDLLAEMPHLEYLSIGKMCGDGKQLFTAATLLPRLKAIPSLKRIWLDGIKMTKTETTQFEAHFEKVRVTYDP